MAREGYRSPEQRYDEPREPASIEALRSLIRDDYTLQQVEHIQTLLEKGDVFMLQPFASGMLPAAGLGHGIATDYHYTWLRDQMIVATVELGCDTGNPIIGARAVEGAMRQSYSQRHRFDAIINHPPLKYYQNNRPHIRWDGANEKELDELWGHAQNDALGHFLTASDRAVTEGLVVPTNHDIAQLGLYPRYLEAIDYTTDEDHGCWEEHPKVNNSSVSIAMDGLKALIRTMRTVNVDAIDAPVSDGHMSIDRIETLIAKAQYVLDRDLPFESVQNGHRREADAALLVPVWTGAIKGEQADAVLELVLSELEGEVGIKRYHHDNYWGENRPDAEWCLFDSMVSSIYGRKYLEGNKTNPDYLQRQIKYFNRALRQVTLNPADSRLFAMPEMYHVVGDHPDGTPRYETNPNTPLLWASSNLHMAFYDMRRTLQAPRDLTSLAI